jgi:dUTP pyrophosphatase
MVDKIKFRRLDQRAQLPKRGSLKAAGLDLYSIEKVVLEPGSRASVRTGLAVEIPEGYYGRVAPRSGLALKNGIDTLAGVIDSDYRGELLILLINTDQKNQYVVDAGSRIAQLIIEAIITPVAEWSDDLPLSDRAASGFGSTGTE